VDPGRFIRDAARPPNPRLIRPPVGISSKIEKIIGPLGSRHCPRLDAMQLVMMCGEPCRVLLHCVETMKAAIPITTCRGDRAQQPQAATAPRSLTARAASQWRVSHIRTARRRGPAGTHIPARAVLAAKIWAFRRDVSARLPSSFQSHSKQKGMRVWRSQPLTLPETTRPIGFHRPAAGGVGKWHSAPATAQVISGRRNRRPCITNPHVIASS